MVGAECAGEGLAYVGGAKRRGEVEDWTEDEGGRIGLEGGGVGERGGNGGRLGGCGAGGGRRRGGCDRMLGN